jgi:hypothetical protein
MTERPDFVPTPPFENTLSSAETMLTRTFQLLPDPEHLSDDQLAETRAKLGRMTMLLVEGDLMLRREQERRAES